MKVSSIAIRNILGIDQLDITPGALTIIAGRNGAGKTSVLEAIRSVLSGGHEPDLVRQGADAGEVTITLADGVEIRKRVTPDKSTLTVKHPQFGKISKSQAWVNKIVDSISLDPVAFLTAPAKERVDILLEALPMRVSREQLSFLPDIALAGKDLDAHALQVLAAIGKDLYDERTGVNRAAKEKRATVSQMNVALPAQPEGGTWQQVDDDTDQAIRDLRAKASKRGDEIRKEAATAENEAKVACAKYEGEVDVELERQIAALRADADGRKGKVREKRDAKIEAAVQERDRQLAEERAAYEPINAKLQEQLGQARAMAAETAKAESTRKLIEDLTAQAGVLEGQSAEFSGWLDQLDVLKASLLEQLPVAGLEIRDGALFVQGVPFDRVNTSAKVRLAIEIAKLKAGELSLIVMDQLECFDGPMFEAFKEEAVRAGLQIIGARVADHELAVETAGVAVQ